MMEKKERKEMFNLEKMENASKTFFVPIACLGGEKSTKIISQKFSIYLYNILCYFGALS